MSPIFNIEKLDNEQVEELNSMIQRVKDHEKVTVTLLGAVLPQTLKHIWGNECVKSVNKLIKSLSPTNKKAALRFFEVMQPHAYGPDKNDNRSKVFGRRINKAHTLQTKRNMQRFFSLDPETDSVNPEKGYFGGDYWAWEAATIKVETKETNWLEYAKKAVNTAADKLGVEVDEFLTQLIDAEGLTPAHLAQVLAKHEEEEEKKVA